MNDIKSYKIYKYTNIINGMSYIGQTSMTLKRRAGYTGKSYMKGTKYFGPAIKQYGWGNFQGEILTETENSEYADFLEWFYTIEFNTQWPNGYNCHIGRKLAEEEINKRRENHPSEESNRKRSKTLKGKQVSEETKRKISENSKGKSKPHSKNGVSNRVKI